MTSSRFTRTRFRAVAAALGIAALAWAAAASAQPDEAIVHYRAGYDLLMKRDFRNAAIELEAAAAIDSTYDVALYGLSRAHGFLGNYIKAADALQAALRHGLQKPPDRAPGPMWTRCARRCSPRPSILSRITGACSAECATAAGSTR